MGDDWFKIGVCLGVAKEVNNIQVEEHRQFDKASKMLQSWKQYVPWQRRNIRRALYETAQV